MISPPSTVHNADLWQKHRRKVRALAQRIISGEVGVIEGSRQMAKFEVWLHARSDEDFRVFAGVNSESDHLPVGEARKHWSSEALLQKDQEILSLEDFYRNEVIAAAHRIRTKFGEEESNQPVQTRPTSRPV